MQLPKLNNLVLRHDYFKGSFRDESGQGNHGTPTGVHFEKRPDKHMRFEGTDVITVADSAELQLTEGTIIAYGDFDSHSGSNVLLAKRDAGGTNYEIYFSSSTTINLLDGTNDRTAVINWQGSKSLAVSFADGEIAKAYKDGAFALNFNAASAVSVDDADLTIGNVYSGTGPCSNPLKGVLIYNTVLTDAEIASVHEWIMTTQTPSYPKKNFVYPEVIGNGEFGKDVLWTKGDGWSIADGKATSDGSQIAISALTQDCTLAPYGKYTATIDVESVSAGGLYLFVGGGSGAHITTVGKHVQVLTAGAAPTNFNIRADSNFVGSINSASLVKGNKPTFIDDFLDYDESIATESGEFLSNSQWRIISGTWKISRRTDQPNGKQIECVTDGQLRYNGLVGADDMYTKQFELVSGTPTLTKNSTNIEIDAVAGDKVGKVHLSYGTY